MSGVSRVAVVSTYPPRACGIATFARDLHQALGDALPAAAHEPAVTLLCALDAAAGDGPLEPVLRGLRRALQPLLEARYADAAVRVADVDQLAAACVASGSIVRFAAELAIEDVDLPPGWIERLRDAAAPLAGYSADVVAARLRSTALGFSGEPPRDDIAILVLRNDQV